MVMMKKTNPNAWLWWIAITSLSIGIAIFILLPPSELDLQIQQYRTMALVSSLLICGLCIIIGTRKRWFGKGL